MRNLFTLKASPVNQCNIVYGMRDTEPPYWFIEVGIVIHFVTGILKGNYVLSVTNILLSSKVSLFFLSISHKVNIVTRVATRQTEACHTSVNHSFALYWDDAMGISRLKE